jgi:hypothetical protein
VPPNDRELIMRARFLFTFSILPLISIHLTLFYSRLKTGWSSRANFIMQSNNNNNEAVNVINHLNMSDNFTNTTNTNATITTTNNNNNNNNINTNRKNSNTILNNHNNINNNTLNKTSKQSPSHHQSRPSITESEFQEIEQVMLRAALIEQKEVDRIK